jgi:hypothetical protein
MTDKQKICKCGNAVGELLWNTVALEDDLKMLTRVEYYHYKSSSIKESIKGIHNDIKNIEGFCPIDTGLEQQYITDAHNKIPPKDATKEIFDTNKNIILEDLSKIRFGIREKMRHCSK